MPKRMRLDLHSLKVRSFVTSLKTTEENRVKGGYTGLPDTCGQICWDESLIPTCPPPSAVNCTIKTNCTCP